MLDSGGQPQMPNDIGTLGRRLVQLERAVQLGGGARTLVRASVGRGGIRVTSGGSIVVEDGGSVIIETGNLILGEGIIDGSALANQLEATQAKDHRSGTGLITAWRTFGLVTLQTPSWATRALIHMYAVSRHRRALDVQTTAMNVRGLIDGEESPYIGFDSALESTGVFAASAQLSWSRLVTNPGSTIRVEYQAQAPGGSNYPAHATNRGDLSVVAFWMR